MILKDYLRDEIIIHNELANAYLRVGPKVHQLRTVAVTVEFAIKKERNKDTPSKNELATENLADDNEHDKAKDSIQRKRKSATSDNHPKRVKQ